MGMFDTIMCSYDLGPGFWNRPLQTKDLLNMMDEYWLDPKGRLWQYDYSGTYDYDGKFRPVKNGRRGAIRPHLLTHSITVYPAKWDSKYCAFPEVIVSFCSGVIISHYKKYK